MPTAPIVWGKPLGPYTVAIGRIQLSETSQVQPGKDYEIQIATLCGREVADMTVSPTEVTTAAQLARRSQVAASIQHVERRACDSCRERFFTLTSDEKRWLYASDPRLGPILGLDAKGVE